jgi:hypothetical protein
MLTGFSREASRVNWLLGRLRPSSLHVRFFGAEAPQNDACPRQVLRGREVRHTGLRVNPTRVEIGTAEGRTLIRTG